MKFIIYIFGFVFTLIGFITNILYINLLYFGYTFKEYMQYLIKSPGFIYFILGVILLNISIFIKGDKNEKNLWYIGEF